MTTQSQSKWRRVGSGAMMDSRGAGSHYTTVTVTLEQHPDLGLRLTASEEWGSDQGSYLEPIGDMGPITALGATYAEARNRLLDLAREVEMSLPLLLEALAEAEEAL